MKAKYNYTNQHCKCDGSLKTRCDVKYYVLYYYYIMLFRIIEINSVQHYIFIIIYFFI